MNDTGIIRLKIKKANDDLLLETNDLLAVEEPLEIVLQHGPAAEQEQKTISITMRTPGNDSELAAGFLFTEGIIRDLLQVKMIIPSASSSNTVLVILKEEIRPFLQQSDRNFYTTSSCGVCGKASIEAIKTVSVFPDAKDNIVLNRQLFYHLQEQLRKEQSIFENTGGLHASALFDLNGQFISLREDVGRHNAVDKLIGEAFLNNRLPLHQSILLLSGRASFELVQKANMAGIRIIAAVGAPSSLAVELADQNNISLIGFLRDRRFNIYSGFERIK